MSLVRSILFIGLAFVFVRIKGQDDGFNLEDVFKDLPTQPPATKPNLPDVPLDFDDPKVPTDPKKKEDDYDGFNLDDAVNGEDKYTPTKAPHKPGGGGGGSGRQFGDDDLAAAADEGYKPDKTDSAGRSGGRSGGTNQGSNQDGGNGTLAGIISGVLLSLAGGVTSYVLYQKKKLCFSLTGNSGEQNMKPDNVQGQREDPQSYSTLLQSQPVTNN
ncbi:CD99 antigen-like protein 2 [Pristis pectinata]|uniref:CD99 antigen-like protein 2 n=1 Tax=Pristis pectinata TaxID=685728 RepID=UPI00223DE329|nr:CD99 antigen-like protein 2 [Pristis pectinata]